MYVYVCVFVPLQAQCSRSYVFPRQNTVYGHVTSSTLLVNVSRAQDGALVTCRAANPAVPGSPLTNSTKLTVLCECSDELLVW